jgi:glucokinase
MYAIGVDIGGMSIKAGVVDENGKILLENREKTAPTHTECIENLKKQIKELLEKLSLNIEDVRGIGIGCPGAVTSETGVVEVLPNLGWEKVPLVEILKQTFDTEIKISNDANVAALGEAVYGCAKEYDNVVMFTLGTGVGGGMIIEKKLFEGGWSRGAELGHTTLVLDGRPCTCGRKGCVETYVSATALIEDTKTAMLENKDSKMWEVVLGDIKNVDGRTAFECSKIGDKTAIEVVDTYVKYLSESIMNMLNIFRPEAFIIGGGISGQGDYLIDKIVDYLERFDYGYKFAPKTKILTATLGNGAGIIGAAALI